MARELTYWIVERNEGEYLIWVDDRWIFLYTAPQMLPDNTAAVNLSNTFGGTAKQVTIIIHD